MICILPFRLMGCESRLCDHNRFHRQSPEFDNHDNQPARWIEAASALPAGERVDNLSWSPDGSRLMFDRTQMLGFYPNPLGVWTTASVGGGLDTLFLNPPAFAAAWH